MKFAVPLVCAGLFVLPSAHVLGGVGSAVTGNVRVDTRTPVAVLIPDNALLAAIRTALGKPTGNITNLDFLSLRNLDLSGLGIADLSGLEFATNLRILNIRRNAFVDAAALWRVLDQITPMYCLYTDVRRPGIDPIGYTTQTVTDTSGNIFFITVDAPNLPTLDISGLGIDTSNRANLGALQTFSGLGVVVETGIVNLPPAASGVFTINDALTGAGTLSAAGSGDVDGTIVNYAWSWSGGSASGMTAAIVLVPGTTTAISLTVTDDDGASSSTIFDVVVERVVTISDPALEAALRVALSRPTGPITEANLLTLTNLNLSGRGISNLSGLEYAKNLRILNIRQNPFSDASSLWLILDQITPMYCLYTDVRRPGSDPLGYTTQTVTDTSGGTFFITVDAPNLPTLDITGLGIDTSNPDNLGALQTFVSAGVTVDTGGINLPPAARATFSTTGNQVVLNGSGSSDVDGTIVRHEWTWLDGSESGANPTISLAFGVTNIDLTVTDDDGATARTSISVSVSPRDDIDTDGDGLNDLSEYALRNLGFDFLIPQPALVARIVAAGLVERSKLAGEGFHDAASMRRAYPNIRFLERDRVSGKARLRVAVQKSPSLANFTSFPATAPNIGVDVTGDIFFEFSSTDPSAFFRMEVK